MRHYGEESYHIRVKVETDLDKVTASTDLERAYIAGFFDGEGTVGLYRNRTSFGVSVSIGQKNPAILLWIQGIFGGTLVSVKPEHNGYSATDLNYQLRFTSRNDALVILRALRPYIRAKKEQVDAVFEFYNTPDLSFEDRTNIVDLVKTLKRA